MSFANVEDIREHLGGYQPKLSPITAADFLKLDIPPRQCILAPWLPVQGLVMIYASRGIGKTFLALETAYTVASGARLLRWSAPEPRRVLFVDGEMPARVLQERLASIAARAEGEPPAPDFLRFIANDLHRDGIPDLATEEGQAALAEHLDGVDLIVLDNLSTLCRSGRENEAESWGAVQEFLLRQRRNGRAVLLVHHAGKGGLQRGTSRREDVLDTSINLSRPDDYRPGEGARFNVSFEKTRGFTGKDAEPFEAALDPVTGVWSMRDLEDVRDAKIIELVGDGLKGTEIAAELGVNKSTVSRAITRLKEAGRLS